MTDAYQTVVAARERVKKALGDVTLLADAVRASLGALGAQAEALKTQLLDVDTLLLTIKPPRPTLADYIAAANGDHTKGFQAALDSGDLYVPEEDNGVYNIDVVNYPKITKDKTIVEIHGAPIFVAIPNDQPRTYFLRCYASNCVIDLGKATLAGDRYKHTYRDTGDAMRTHEHGFGVMIAGANNVLCGGKVTRVPGDAVGITGPGHKVFGMVIDENRRNGISVYRAPGAKIFGNKITNTGNLATNKVDPAGLIGPFCAIDVEPDKGSAIGVEIYDNEMRDNQKGGVALWVRDEVVDSYLDVLIRNNLIVGSPNNVWMKDEMVGRAPRIKAKIIGNDLSFTTGHNIRVDEGAVCQIGSDDSVDANLMQQAGRTRTSYDNRSGILTPYIGRYGSGVVLAGGLNNYR